MGNVMHRHHKYPENDELQESMRKKCFWSLSNGNEVIKLSALETKLSNHLAEPLYNYLSENDTLQVTLEEFCKKGLPLLGNSTDIYFHIFQPFEKLLDACFEAANIGIEDSDGPFIAAFTENMKSDGDTPEAMANRKNQICPGLCFSIQAKIFDIFFNRQRIIYDMSSNVLTPAQMYILYGMLPETVYFNRSKFKSENFNGKEWDLLWNATNNNSAELTPKNFEKNVFDYAGPTVTIVKDKDGEIFAVAIDEKWQNSNKKFGGSYSNLIKFLPKVDRIIGDDKVYCNFSMDTYYIHGIVWGNDILVKPDMSNVEKIEIWGCGVAKEAEEVPISTEKVEARPAVPRTKGEFNRKPDNDEWDVDKQLLEMAGFEFDRHRRAGPVRPPDEE